MLPNTMIRDSKVYKVLMQLDVSLVLRNNETKMHSFQDQFNFFDSEHGYI